MRVGVIGLGRMGLPMAKCLRKSFTVMGWDLSEAARIQADEAGITLVTPESFGSRCDVVLMSLPSPTAVEVVLTDANGLLSQPSPGLIVVDTSTSDPASARRCAAIISQRRGHFLDAPVLGRPEVCGAWTLPVGGEPAVLERARSVLEKIAHRVVLVGGNGAGHMVKLLNCMMFAAINVVTAEVIGACSKLGLDPATYFDVVGESRAATVSPLFSSLVPKMLSADYHPIFTVDLLHKDLTLAIKMCEAQGVPLISARANQILVDLGRARGLGLLDTSSLIQIYQQSHA